jgi:glycerophosphoryl diester phosphodiesterase
LECLAAGCLLNSAIRIGVLTEENLDFGCQFIQASSIHPDYHLLTAENTAKLQEKGFQALNEPKDIKK